MKQFLVLVSILVGFSACTVVKPYDRAYLNDEDMELGERNSEHYERNMETYREGASGANGGKTGGGCGCN